MLINRRRFMQLSGALAGTALMPELAAAQERFITIQGAWRKFEILTQLKFAKPDQSAQAWIPVPSVNQDDWSKALGSDWKTNAKTARLEKTETGADLVYLEWDESEPVAIAEISSHSETRDRLTDFTRPAPAKPLTDDELRLYTKPTTVLPQTDRLRKMAATAVENAETDLGKAKAIYEWIAREQTCDTNDLKTLLGGAETSGAIPQDCDYLNRLFVGLSRVSGLPAREINGVRVAASVYGFESLGAQPEDVTARLHNRAEVWLASYGWVPVDPADLLRLVRYEPPGNLELTAPKAVSARVTLFGAWEGNWVAYNMAHDIALPESGGVLLPIFVRPVVRIGATAPMQARAPEITYKLIANELPAGP